MGKRKISEEDLKSIIGAGKFGYSFNYNKNKNQKEEKKQS